MTYSIVKVFVSAILIVTISELGKRSSFVAGLVASLPLVSLLAFLWLYIDTKDTQQVASLAGSIFWLVLPSLVLFLALPWMLRLGYGFYLSLIVAIVLTALAYYLMIVTLKVFNVSL